MIIIAGHVLVDESERDRYVEELRALVERARSFDGCIDLAITADSIDLGRVNNLEIWESKEALDAWRAQANPPDLDLTIVHEAVQRYEATDGGPLF